MRNLRKLIAMAAVALCGVTASAQSAAEKEAQDLGYKPQPYGFIQVQGGINALFTDIPFTKTISPTYGVGVGGMFTPIVGARLHVNGYKAKSGFDAWADGLDHGTQTYKWNYVTSDLDLMLNLTNIISKKNNHLFNLYLIGGVGLNYSWKNDEFHALTNANLPANDINNAWGEGCERNSLLNHNIRVGLLADFNIAKHWSIGAEVDLNSLDDRFNSKYADKDDWMLTAALSVTYKFGFKKAQKPTPAPVEPKPVVREEPKPVAPATPVVAPVEEPKKVEVVKEEPLKEVFYYQIRESDPDPESILKKVVEWCNKYPNKTISVDGYADKGTGNAKINVKYAKQRAQKVADKLQSMGIAANRMIVKSYGDTVQPFDENDRNRCVIIVGQ